MKRETIRLWLRKYHMMDAHLNEVAGVLDRLRQAKVKKTPMVADWEKELLELSALKLAIETELVKISGTVYEEIYQLRYLEGLEWKVLPDRIKNYELSSIQQYEQKMIDEINALYQERVG